MAKKSLDDGGEGAAVAVATPTAHGVVLSMGDVKGGGTAKKPLVAVLPRKSIKIVKGFNPRNNIGDIEVLADSIKKDGLLSPVVVRPAKEAGVFELVTGERRLRACDLICLDEIPATIRTDLAGDDERAKATAIAENSEDGRTNLNHVEVGRVCADLEKKGWSVQRIASECAVHAATVRRCLDIVSAPKDVVAQVASGQTSLIAGLEIAKLDDKTRKAIKDKLTVGISAADVRKLAKSAAQESGAAATGKGDARHRKGAARDAALKAWRQSRAKGEKLIELCHVHETAGAEMGTKPWHEIRGAIAYGLWDRGELKDAILPDLDTKDAGEKKLLAKVAGIIAEEAAKHEEAKAELEAEKDAEKAAAADGGE